MKSWERASTTKDVKDQNIPKHTKSKIKFIMNALQPTTSFPDCFFKEMCDFHSLKIRIKSQGYGEFYISFDSWS